MDMKGFVYGLKFLVPLVLAVLAIKLFLDYRAEKDNVMASAARPGDAIRGAY
jgi:hypothetical protein